MNITEELKGLSNPTIEEQQAFLVKLKEQKIFDLNETEKSEVVDFLCEKAEQKLAIDYLYHVLDNEISYPMDDDKVKTLFVDERMIALKEIMLSELNDESEDEVSK